MALPLPVPIPDYFDNNNLSHSFKQLDTLKRSKRRPPKLYPKQEISFSRSFYHNEVNIISFKNQDSWPSAGRSFLTTSTPKTRSSNSSSDSQMSNLYNRHNNQTYYEQLFQPIKKIGEGSFAEVFQVKSKEDDNLYAVKKIRYSHRGENYRQERLQEVRRLEEFSDHEHCVTLYKAWEQNEDLYMQLELCKYSLESYAIEQKTVPEPMVWSVLVDLLMALKSLHDRDLIHLDIKLDNILITKDNICKLADFGLVFDLNSLGSSSATEGDNRYIAPELMNGNFCKANDIFSLGITLLEFSCNLNLPSNGDLWQQLRNAVFPEEYMKCISVELQDLIKWMMDPSVENRPTVETLLTQPKVQRILNQRLRRKKFQSIIKIKNNVINLWNKFKVFIILTFAMFKSFFTLKSTKNNFNNCSYNNRTPNHNIQINISRHTEDSDDDNFLANISKNTSKMSKSSIEDDDNNNKSNVTPTLNVSIPRITPDAKIANSTPLNHMNGLTNKKLRRKCFELGDSPANSMRDKSGGSSLFEKDTSSLICKKLVFCEDD